jgi:hypothetical protein
MQRSPTPNDWRVIQGGAPLLLESPGRQLFEIIHAYRSDDERYKGPLAIVPTPRDQLLGSALIHLSVPTSTDDLIVPAALLWQHHGHPCESIPGSLPYQRLPAEAVDRYVQHSLSNGWKQKAIIAQMYRN